MGKSLYLVRHSKAEGQAPDAPLTDDGRTQAEKLADVLSTMGIERIVSSPFLRARQSIKPLADRLKLPIETDERLIEANLSTINYPDWKERLRESFTNYDLCYEGGESSREATNRVVAAIEEILQSNAQTITVVTHGRLLTLLLKHFDDRFGFKDWESLSGPDLFRVKLGPQGPQVQRLWK